MKLESDEPWGWRERLLYAPADGFGALFVGDIESKQRVEEALVKELGKVTKASLERTGSEESSSGSQVEDPKRSYVRLRSKLKRPGDGMELFKRIVLNAVVGNTDDHPWNTSLRQVGLGDWELAPLYDVLPSFSHTGRPVFRMAITDRHERVGSLANLVRAGKLIGGLDEDSARQLIADIGGRVKNDWRAVFEKHAQGRTEVNARDRVPVFECDGMV